MPEPTASGAAPYDAATDAVVAEVATSGRLGHPRCVLEPPAERGRLEGEVEVVGRLVTLQVDLSPPFPLALPPLYLRPSDELGAIPHVLAGGGLVCHAQGEGLVLDRRRPADIIVEALARAVAVLAAGTAGVNRADFADEFESYWAAVATGDAIPSILDPTGDVREVIVYQTDGRPTIIAATEGDFVAFHNGTTVSGKRTRRNAVHLALEPGTVIVPPPAGHAFWSARDARAALLPGLCADGAKRLRKLVAGRPGRSEFVIVTLPRPAGGASLFALRFDGVGDVHPLVDGGTAERVVPLRLDRRDRSFIVPRGGGDAGIAGRRVLLVGAGAVGGHLAFELVRAGVDDLTIVDDDRLRPENTYRHALGRRYWGSLKADALKTELEIEFPYVRVHAVRSRIEAAVASRAVSFAEFDLVVFAAANPTVELEMNAHARGAAGAPPVMFTWLEPYGIGGHALVGGGDRGPGCFECLYTPPAGDGTALDNRAAFAAPGQAFGRALSGCGSLHTPYGSAHAVQTAALAAQLATEVLTGRERGSPLRSWKGDGSAFTAAGFRLAPRHAAAEEQLRNQQYAYASPRCRVCAAPPTPGGSPR